MAIPRKDPFMFTPAKSLYVVETSKDNEIFYDTAMIVGDSLLGALRDWMQMHGLDHDMHILLRSDIANHEAAIAQDTIAVYRVDLADLETGPVLVGRPGGLEFVTAFDVLVSDRQDDDGGEDQTSSFDPDRILWLKQHAEDVAQELRETMDEIGNLQRGA